MPKIHVVIVEWMGYPIFRKKQLKQNVVKCGLGRLLQNIDKFSSGVEFDCTVVLNKDPERKFSSLLYKILRLPLMRKLFERSVITNSEDKYREILSRYNFIGDVIVRDNFGQDIGAYNKAHQLLLQSDYRGDVVFMNSSVSGPSNENWLKKYQDLFYREINTGFCGISLNAICDRKFAPHVQSFFLYSNMEVLRKVFPKHLVDDSTLQNKWSLINEGETGISRMVLEAGYGIRCSAFPEFFYMKGDEWTITRSDIRYEKEYQKYANAI